MSQKPPPLPGNPERKVLSKICLIVCQVLQGLTLLPWPFMAMTAFMVFDAPGSTSHWQPWLFALTIWTYPVWLVLAGVGSWLLFLRGKRAAALWLSFVFLLPIPAFFLYVFLS